MPVNLEQRSPLHSFLLIIMVLIILYLLYKIFNKREVDIPTTSSIQSQSTTTSQETTTSNSSYNKVLIDKGLDVANITKVGQENFQNDLIVIDTADKLNKNFSYFISTYLKMFNIDNINNIVKKYTNKTMSEIETSINIPFFYIYDNFMKGFADVIFITGSNTDKILFGLSLLPMYKADFNRNNINVSIYYYNDFETVGDFVIYFVPSNYTGDVSNLNRATTSSEPTPFKYELFKLIEEGIKNRLSSMPGTDEEKYQMYISKITKNKNINIQIAEIMLACYYICANNNYTILSDTPVIKELFDIIYQLNPNTKLDSLSSMIQNNVRKGLLDEAASNARSSAPTTSMST